MFLVMDLHRFHKHDGKEIWQKGLVKSKLLSKLNQPGKRDWLLYIEEHNNRNHVRACDNDANSENEEERFMEAFRAFDKDCDGFLKKPELKRVLYKLNLPVTEDDLDTIIREADLNKDGKIDFKEFRRTMLKD